MPLVKAIPKGLQNGNIITEFTDTTNLSSVTYTYPTQQTSLIIENSGEKDIFVTVGSYTNQVINADKKWRVDVPFSSFSVRSDVNSQEFIATAIYKSVEDLASLTSQLAHTSKQLQITPLVNKGMAFETIAENTHVAWTNANVDFDKTTKEILVFYDAQPTHSLVGNVTYLRKKPVKGNFGNAIKIADLTGSNISCKSQSSGICANGDYISIVARITMADSMAYGTWVYRSTNKGVTWDAGTEIRIGGNPVISHNGDVTGFLKLNSGRIILFGYYEGTNKVFSLYSNDNGLTWQYGTVGDGNNTYWMEPATVELSDGTVIALFRSGLYSVEAETPAGFSKSTDGGINWSNIINSTTVTDMMQNNGAFVPHEDTKTVELVYGSRFTQPDGFTSTYQCIATEEDAKNGNFGTQYRIGKNVSYGFNMATSQADFGYFGATKTDDGAVYVFYYSGTKSLSNIYYMVGSSKLNLAEMQPPINQLTYENYTKKDNTTTLLYENGDEQTTLTGNWFESYVDGTNTDRTKKTNFLELSVNGTQGNASYMPNNGIDVTNKNYIYAMVFVGNVSGNAKIGIYVYNKKTPASVGDGRVAFANVTTNGFNLIKIDVRSITGIVYPALMVNCIGTGTIIAKVFRVWADSGVFTDVIDVNLTSKIINYLMVEQAGKNYLYTEGKEKTLITGGWKDGFSLGTGTLTRVKNSDNLQLSANGADGVGGNICYIVTTGIDVTNIKYIYATIQITSQSGTSDTGVSVFNIPNPTSAADGRVANKFVSSLGVNTIKVDVTAITGIVYPALVANKNTVGVGDITVKVFEVWTV